MGYSSGGRLARVELPLALPLVVGGIRLASVSTIGLVTVSGILGDRFGGLGFFIFEGYHHSFPTEILFGAVPTIVLAIAVDLVLVAVQRRLTPWAPASTGRAPAGPGPSWRREPRREQRSNGLRTRATGRAPAGIPARLAEHLALSGISLALAMVIAAAGRHLDRAYRRGSRRSP